MDFTTNPWVYPQRGFLAFSIIQGSGKRFISERAMRSLHFSVSAFWGAVHAIKQVAPQATISFNKFLFISVEFCLLYTSDAADEEDSVDLGGRRIIKKKTH